jgi:hypothetical protein
MMNTKFVRTAALALAAALAAAPAISHAATTQAGAPVKMSYTTTLEPITGLGAPWTGSLDLTFNPDGIIQGWYHPADNLMAFIPVTGGRSGDKVWLDIGTNGRLHVDGRLKNGVIKGTAFDQSSTQAYDFRARVGA